MDKAFWLARWMENEIGFHQAEINTYLETCWPALQAAPGTVFVPLCGKSRDMLWLAGQGRRVLGVEISPIAVQAFFTDNKLTRVSQDQPPFIAHRSGEITLLEGDFFALQAAHLHDIAAVYDRASLIALPPAMRRDYATHMARLLRSDVPILLITLDYPQSAMDGPPFAVSPPEVDALFASAFHIETLCEHDILPDMPGFQTRGLTVLIERAYLLRRR